MTSMWSFQETMSPLFPAVLAADPGHGRPSEEEASRGVPRPHRRDAGLPRLLSVDDRDVGGYQDVPLLHHRPVPGHEAPVRALSKVFTQLLSVIFLSSEAHPIYLPLLGFKAQSNPVVKRE